MPVEQNLAELAHSSPTPILDTNNNTYDDEVEVHYSDPDGLLITVVMRLRGGGQTSFESSMAETIHITNTRPFSVNVSFFQYSDLDVNGFAGDDEVGIIGAAHRVAIHGDPAITVRQTISGIPPTHFEADVIDGTNDLLNRLNDTSGTVLADISGPLVGNVSYAYQWDLTLGPSGGSGDTATISILKELAPTSAPEVPLGGPLLLLALVLALTLGGAYSLAGRWRIA